jgi:type I restriction enzyme M protein
MTANFSQIAVNIWSLADLSHRDFKQSQYGLVILLFMIFRRLECVLEARKPQVFEQVEKLKAMPARFFSISNLVSFWRSWLWCLLI